MKICKNISRKFEPMHHDWAYFCGKPEEKCPHLVADYKCNYCVHPERREMFAVEGSVTNLELREEVE